MIELREISSSEIIDLIHNEFLKPIILTPGPKEADIIRSIDKSFLFEKGLDPITISNFINGIIDTLCRADIYPKEFNKTVSKKADLYLNLAGVWFSRKLDVPVIMIDPGMMPTLIADSHLKSLGERTHPLEVAVKIKHITDNLTIKDTGKFLDKFGEEVPW